MLSAALDDSSARTPRQADTTHGTDSSAHTPRQAETTSPTDGAAVPTEVSRAQESSQGSSPSTEISVMFCSPATDPAVTTATQASAETDTWPLQFLQRI